MSIRNINLQKDSHFELIPKVSLNVSNENLSNSLDSETFLCASVNQEPHLQALVKTLENRESHQVLSQNSPLNLSGFQKNRTLSYLIDESALNKALTSNLWDLNLRKTLSDLQSRLYENSLIKFRIGGRAIYSESQIVRAKSSQTIEETNQTRDEMFIKECDAEDLGDSECMLEHNCDCENDENEITNSVISELNSSTSNSKSKDKIVQLVETIEDLNINYGFEMANCDNSADDIDDGITTNSENLCSLFPNPILYNEDKNGVRFIKGPLREVVKHSRFEDLTKALLKTLNYQLIKPSRTKHNSSTIDEESKNILPENILKKAEDDRALVEEQISKMYEKILQFSSDNHDSHELTFFDLIISADIDGIVRTLLYLLHLVNRKKIQLWQEFNEKATDCFNYGSRILIAPSI